jgi:hypothetical protein
MIDYCCGETCSITLDKSSVRINSLSKASSGTISRAEIRINAGPQLRILLSAINSSHLRRNALLVDKPKKSPRIGRILRCIIIEFVVIKIAGDEIIILSPVGTNLTIIFGVNDGW